MSSRQQVGIAHATLVAGTRTIATALGNWLSARDVRAALLATCGLRVLCSLVATAAPLLLPAMYPWLNPYLADHIHHASYPPNTPLPQYGPLDYLIQPWNRWDTAWYVDIAQHGYATYGTSAFMPLYPLLIWLSKPLTGGDALAAALVVATAAAFFAFLALYRLAERLAPELAPDTLLVASVLPTAFFFVAGYTESLFLALALWAIVASIDRHWLTVGVLSGLAVLTRQQGVLLALLGVPVAWATVQVIWAQLGHGAKQSAAQREGDRLMRRRRATAAVAEHLSASTQSPWWKVLVALAAPLVVYASWLGLLHIVMRVPLPWEPLGAGAGWNLRLTWPGSGLLADIWQLVTHPPTGLAELVQSPLLDLAASVAAAIGLVLARRMLPAGVIWYLAALWCTSQMKVLANGTTASEARYMLQLLPLCIVPAGWLKRGGRWVRLTWIACNLTCLMLYLWIFVLWGWVA